MFSEPLSKIEYSDVEVFCNTFGEGVRVEYKSEMIENIPKTISAFANTLGGILIIGAETDDQNKVTAINGIDKKAGIEEGVIDSSLNGIYPSVIPEVRIFEIPDKKDKVVVVIKIHESAQVPHAIQNSTRVYIRTGSTSQPYELAEIDRIEYVLKRREKPERLKNELMGEAQDRLQKLLGGHFGPHAPALSLSIVPPFPYQPLISLDKLYTFCNSGNYYSPIRHVGDPKRVADGICKFHGNVRDYSYTEINHYGLVFARDTLDKSKSQWRSIARKEDEKEELYIRLTHIILIIGKTLKLADSFYKNCGYLGNIEIKVNIENVAGESLMYSDEDFPDHDEFKSIDNGVSSSLLTVTEEIDLNLVKIVGVLLQNILWIFNCSRNPEGRVKAVLLANHLIEKEQKSESS